MQSTATRYPSGEPASLAPTLRRWLFSGACQSESGAFCAWRDAESGRLAFEYPEITGYVLTFAASLADLDKAETASARRGADWLVSRLAQTDYSARTGWDDGAAYIFDLAMVATGLISFGRLHGDVYIDSGLKLVRLIVLESGAAGQVPAVARGAEASHPGWATEGRAHLLKVVQCLLLGEEHGVLGALDCARTLIAEGPALQQRSGRFLTEPRVHSTMLHPHHYALEGLWVWATARGDRRALEQARAGVLWAWEQQLPTGGFPRFAPSDAGDSAPEQSDATAQAIRLALLVQVEPEGFDRALRRLEESTVGNDDGRAVPYQPAALPQHQNVWATLCAAQTLGLVGTERKLAWQSLV
jgi:hypothetical protein